MEGIGTQQIFMLSENSYNHRFIKYLGDGDSNSCSSIVASKPYRITEIQKLECINHVHKHMGVRLRRLKKKCEGNNLEDEKSLSGKNRLTQKKINQIQFYYGKAIKEIENDLEVMKFAVWAVYFDTLSIDVHSQHELCPKGITSWCKCNKALGENKTYTHKNNLPQAIMDAIKPTFKALTYPDLLKKCLHNTTQNVNGSCNQVIWTRIPKNAFISMRTLELGLYDAVSNYNDGNVSNCRVFSSIDIQPEFEVADDMQNLDLDRVRDAEKSDIELYSIGQKKGKAEKKKN